MGRPDKSVKRPKKKDDPKMTEPKLELDHIFDSERLIPDKRITIVLDGKLILTHGLTAFDMPMIHGYAVKYFKLLEYSYNKFPILQFTKYHYQMKNGWKITLEHWWIPNVPLSERYYAHDIHVPRSTKGKHNHWTDEDWKTNLLKFDYLSDDYEMQAWIHRLPEIGIPLQNVPVKDIVEFTPPEPETNICPICGDVIPDDTLRSPNFLCKKCKRPIACVSCKEEVLEAVGITECPWCHTDAESTEKIKHAIRVRKEKEEYETQKASDEIWTTDNAKISMVSARTDQFLDFPEHGEGTPYSSMTHAIAGLQDQYPHRDDDDLMKAKKGWGVPFDIPSKPDFLSGIKEPMKSAVLEREEYLKEEAQRGTGRSTQRRLSAMNHLYHRESNRLYMDRRVLFIVDNMKMVKDTVGALEDLYMKRFNLGSGAFETLFTKKGKIIDVVSLNGMPMRGKKYTLVVFDLVAPIERTHAKSLRMDVSRYGCPIIGGESIVETEEDPNNADKESGFDITKAKVIIGDQEIPVSNMKMTMNNEVQPVYGFGEREAVTYNKGPTTVEGTFKGVVGLPANEKATYEGGIKAEIDRKDIIGYAVDAATKGGAIAVYKKGDNDIVKVRLVEPGRVFKPGDLVYADDVYPPNDPIMQQSKRIPSRMEKPPRTALRCFKCGQKPDDCTCKESRFTLLGETGWKWALFFLFFFFLTLLGLM